jgi:hypothetical protein
METNWKIVNLKRDPNNGLVFEVTYIMNFKLQEESDRKVGMITLEGDPADKDFVPFEQLTEEIIIDWVKTVLGEEEINKIKSEHETRIQERIDRKNNPEFLQGLPWSKN